MSEIKPNRQLSILIGISTVAAFCLGGMAVWGFGDLIKNHVSFIDFFSKGKNEIIYAIAAAIIVLLATILNHKEQQRVDAINKPWNVKPPTF
jgi:uncharacterized Tic20 family protein